MAEQPSQEFQHEALEADIKRLAEEIAKRREGPEAGRLTERELVKKTIQALTGAPPAASAPASPQQPSGLPAYLQEAPAEAKLEVEYLLDLAIHHGLEKAAAEAKKSSPFVLDAFHDALANKLYPELQKRGILK